MLRLVLAATLFCCGGALAQPAADEAEDFAVAPSTQLKLVGHASPTPLVVPGARTIATAELRRELQAPLEERPLVFDVLSDPHPSLPGAIWLPGAGLGTGFDDAVQARLAKLLRFITGGRTDRELVFLCSGPRCWLSYNAALRAVRLGYTGVRWYRGGIEAWGESGGALREPRVAWDRPAE
ncbi:MAG TPA: rhodanese-like domain-containing protein [Burkholderiales bacterium]